jgi:hypothetical protein
MPRFEASAFFVRRPSSLATRQETHRGFVDVALVRSSCLVRTINERKRTMGRRIDLLRELAAALANLTPAHRALLLADDDESHRAQDEGSCD